MLSNSHLTIVNTVLEPRSKCLPVVQLKFPQQDAQQSHYKQTQ